MNINLNDIIHEAINNDERFFEDEAAFRFMEGYDELAELACPEEWYDE